VPKAILGIEYTNMTISTNSVFVPGSPNVDDVNVSVRIDHTNDANLNIAILREGWGVGLISTGNTAGTNFGTGSCGAGELRTVFDCEAPTSISNGIAPYVGSFKPYLWGPDPPLTYFNGGPVNGDWELIVGNESPGQGGTLLCWGLQITYHVCLVYNSMPVATNDAYSVNQNTTLSVNASGVLLNDFDADEEGLTAVTNTSPAHGALTLNADGGFTYIPETNYWGDDSFTYRANDGTANSEPASVIIHVIGIPVITNQPVSRTNVVGTTATFNVGVSGEPPLSYQWHKGGTNLPGSIESTLTLTNVGRRDSGVYAVLVTNLYDSVLSSNATLVVRVPQRLSTPVLLPDGTCVILSGDMDGGLLSTNDLPNFEVQAGTNLVEWVLLTNDLTLTNGQLWLRDADSTNFPLRFYRIIEH
jgi:VCBS repeat-containing protein